MSYDIFANASFTASAKVRYFVPRLFGAWIYSVAIAGLFLIWVGQQCIASGRMFRDQFEYGYEFGTEVFMCPLTCDIGYEVAEVAEVRPVAVQMAYDLNCTVNEAGAIAVFSASFYQTVAEMFTTADNLVYIWSEKDTLKSLRNACKNLPVNRGYSRWTKQQCLDALAVELA